LSQQLLVEVNIHMKSAQFQSKFEKPGSAYGYSKIEVQSNMHDGRFEML